MKNVNKLLAAVAISAFMAVSASAFAADTNTTDAAKPAAHKAMHHHHHMACKKDKKGHCMKEHHAAESHANAAPHETWMGTPNSTNNKSPNDE